MMQDAQEQLNHSLRSLRLGGGDFALPEGTAPYIFFVADGSARLHTPSGILDYVAGQYSVSTIDMPFRGEIVELSEHGDFVALSVAFSADDVFSVLMSLEGNLAKEIARGKLPAAFVERADRNVADCLARLAALLDDGRSLAFMAEHLKREILFNVLCGPCGSRFLQSLIGTNQDGEIFGINSWIKRNFKESWTVEDIARRNNMSVSALHKKFKGAIGMGLLQCQKRLRLSEARRLMLNGELNVTDAAMEVGYESVSQFIRDYKKMFGCPPKDDVKNLRARFAGTDKK